MSSTSPSLRNIQRQHREQNSSSGKFHIFLCFTAAILLLFGTLYMMLRRCREVKSEITRQQQQQEEILLRNDERQQPIAPPESPPPPYEKVVQPSTER
ncbi:unnamed protein product [Rotaria sordida]|uniref:Uncharacterized protein n=1 Tax=Rotaria sordida TaxID=392033 RepID=A0A815NSD1_9BILA|nr:unnamed protein product [Rotaria sordida]CAF1438416.1 unnamed protein product [Rotaria sordida]